MQCGSGDASDAVDADAGRRSELAVKKGSHNEVNHMDAPEQIGHILYLEVNGPDMPADQGGNGQNSSARINALSNRKS